MLRKYNTLLSLVAICILSTLGGLILAVTLSSCGHNVVTHSRGIGMDVSWDGSSYIPNFRLGQWDVTNAVVKENMDLEASTITKADANTTVSGETTGANGVQAGASGGIQIKMKSGPQTNGYVKDVLTSETLSEHSVEMAKAIYSVKSEMPSLGTKTEVTSSGEVKVEQNTTPVATTTTETKTESVSDSGTTETKTTTTVTAIPVKEETQEAVQTVTESVSNAVKTDWWYYLAAAVVAILGGGGVVGYLLGKKKSSSTTRTTIKPFPHYQINVQDNSSTTPEQEPVTAIKQDTDKPIVVQSTDSTKQ